MKTILKLVLWALTFAAVSAIAAPKLQDHGLKTDFLEYNEKFFYGGLPQSTSVSWGDLSEWDDMGRTIQRSDGSYLIAIDPKYHAVLKQARMSLLHEMCHIKIMMRVNVVPGTGKDRIRRTRRARGCVRRMHGRFSEEGCFS